jgi:hypothetical protein
MIGQIELPKAYALTQGMARIAGVNLAAAVVDGWLSRAEFDCLIDTCQNCGRSSRCLDWFATARSAPLPVYCRNKAGIEALAP